MDNGHLTALAADLAVLDERGDLAVKGGVHRAGRSGKRTLQHSLQNFNDGAVRLHVD